MNSGESNISSEGLTLTVDNRKKKFEKMYIICSKCGQFVHFKRNYQKIGVSLVGSSNSDDAINIIYPVGHDNYVIWIRHVHPHDLSFVKTSFFNGALWTFRPFNEKHERYFTFFSKRKQKKKHLSDWATLAQSLQEREGD